jgi:hypothetical protein
VHDVVRERKRSMILVDGWVDVQERTFTRWTNYQLSKRKMNIPDLKTGLSDGLALCALVEVLSKRTLPSKAKAAKNQVQRLDNLRIAFDFMERERGIHLVNVRPGDVEGGNLKIILGLIWGLIHKYMIADMQAKATEAKKPAAEGDSTDASATSAPAAASTSSTSESGAKQELLKWVNQQVAPYNIGTATDFSRSWQDGKILSALVDSLEESLKKAKEPTPAEDASSTSAASSSDRPLTLSGDALTDTHDSIDKAEKVYSIPALMDAGDIVNRPQEHSLMTYISCFREAIVQAREDAEEARRREEEAAARAKVAQEAQELADAEAAEAAAQQKADDEAIAVVLNPSTPAKSPASNFLDPGGLDGSAVDDSGEVTVPLSPLHVEKVAHEDVGVGAVTEDDAPKTTDGHTPNSGEDDADNSGRSTPTAGATAGEAQQDTRPTHERLSSTTLTAEELATLSARPRKDSQPELVGAYIDSDSLEVAVSTPKAGGRRSLASPTSATPTQKTIPEDGEPVGASSTAPPANPDDAVPSDYDSEKQSALDAATAPMDIERKTEQIEIPSAKAGSSSSSSSSPSDPEGPRPDPNAVDDYQAEEEDSEGRLRGETVQQSIDRRIERMMNGEDGTRSAG